MRRGDVRVVGAEIRRLGAEGVEFVGGGGAAEPFDVIVLATGYDKAKAPHATFLPPEVASASLGPHGLLESGRSSSPGLFYSGYTDHSGRLAEIYHESAAIVEEIVAAGLATPFDRARRRGELPPPLSRQAVAALPPACV